MPVPECDESRDHRQSEQRGIDTRWRSRCGYSVGDCWLASATHDPTQAALLLTEVEQRWLLDRGIEYLTYRQPNVEAWSGQAAIESAQVLPS